MSNQCASCESSCTVAVLYHICIKSFNTNKIVTSVPEALDNLIPGIGKISVLTLRGGFSVNQSTLTRLYSIHTFVLPLVTLILVIIHFSMLRKQGISGPQ